MDADEYQQLCKTTAVYPRGVHQTNVVYACLGLAGETGETLEKVKKFIRNSGNPDEMPDDLKIEVAKELGDVLWYSAALASDLGFTLSQVMQINLDKLASRKARGVITSAGDNR